MQRKTEARGGKNALGRIKEWRQKKKTEAKNVIRGGHFQKALKRRRKLLRPRETGEKKVVKRVC